LARDVLYGSRDNVNFVHEVYRQAFLLNFTHSSAIRKAITIYKDWIQMSAPEIPPFLLEPIDTGRARLPSSDSSSIEASEKAVFNNSSFLNIIQVDGGRESRVDSHSSLTDDLHVRAGLQVSYKKLFANFS